MPKSLDDFRNVFVFHGDKEPSAVDLKLYKLITVTYTLITELVFGEQASEAFRRHLCCIKTIIPHKAEVDTIMARLLEKLRTGWCYTPDPRQTMFEVIKGILDVYFYDNQECHVCWLSNGLFDHMQIYDDWQKSFNDIKLKHELAETDKHNMFPSPADDGGVKSQA